MTEATKAIGGDGARAPKVMDAPAVVRLP